MNIVIGFFISIIIFTINAQCLTLDDFKVTKINVDGRELMVAVADSQSKKEQGLSGTEIADLKRRFLDGMLFVFDNDEERYFQAWYMRYDLMLLSLEKISKNKYTVRERKPLRISTTEKIKGKYILEIPLAR